MGIPALILLATLLVVVIVAALLIVRIKRQDAALARNARQLDEEKSRSRLFSSELGATKEQLQRYSEIQSLEEAAAKLRQVVDSTQGQIQSGQQERTQLQLELLKMRTELEQYRIQAHVLEFGLYEPTFSFEDASQYKVALDENYAQQKRMIKDDVAALCSKTWTVDGDVRKGRKMTEQNLKLMLWAFNGECDSLISQVRYDNIVKIEALIKKLYDRLNKLGEEKSCAITAPFLNLKLAELALVHEYKEKKQQQAEEQRMFREKMREEEKARRELERAQQEAERETVRYQQALEKAQKEAEKAHGDKLTKLQEEIERINQLLAEANARKERAISQAQLTRSGYVYVISNVGSFGESVYKIGMTRRLDPTERVDELGDASVPFPFDIHAMIYSEDAPKLENTLHRVFERRRVNLVNMRKEFFQVDLAEIRQVVIKQHGEFQLTLIAEAEEYRKSQMKRAETATPNPPPSLRLDDASTLDAIGN